LWQQLYISERGWWITHFPQNIVLILLTAMFSHHIIENPFLKLKSKFSGKKDPTRLGQEKPQVVLFKEKQAG
jgi:peptidoglycan/LPS O-acetylase OafA/YrhL